MYLVGNILKDIVTSIEAIKGIGIYENKGTKNKIKIRIIIPEKNWLNLEVAPL